MDKLPAPTTVDQAPATDTPTRRADVRRGARLCRTIITSCRASKGGWRQVGRKRLAKLLGCSERQVSRYTAELVEAGLLVKVRPRYEVRPEGPRAIECQRYKPVDNRKSPGRPDLTRLSGDPLNRGSGGRPTGPQGPLVPEICGDHGSEAGLMPDGRPRCPSCRRQHRFF